MFRDWRAGAVEPGDGLPEPDSWEPVTVPGKPTAFAGAEAVAYRATFEDPRSAETEHAMLRLEGVYAHARIWVNGSLVGEHDTYFEPLQIRLGDSLTAENELLVECRRPTDRFGGGYESDRVPETEAVPGIWWDASLEPYSDSAIVDLSARPRLTDDSARFEVRTTVLAEHDLDNRVTFSVKPEGERRGRGMMNRAPVEADAGERTTVEHTIDIRDPALWWPHEMGEQHRYVVRAKLDDDERTLTTGLCSVEYDGEDLLVNGQPTTGRGVNLFLSDPADIERALEVNANLVRTHAHVPEPGVFDAADDAGVLLWSDLPLTGPGSFDVERGQDLASALAGTYDHHPSLAAVGVHDDPVSLGAGPLGSGVFDRLRLRWRMWRASYDREAADAVAEALPTDTLTVPVIGAPGIDADAATLSPGWEYGEAADIAWLLERYPELGDVVAAYGAASLGSAPDAEDIPGFDRTLHDRRVDGDREASQTYQREVLGTITEQLRLNGSDLMIVSALRDTAGAGMGVYTDDGDPKPAQQTLASAFEPIQALLADPKPGAESAVIVLNETPASSTGTLAWDAGDVSGTTSVTLEGNDRKSVTSIDIPSEATTVEISVSVSDQSVSNTYRL